MEIILVIVIVIIYYIIKNITNTHQNDINSNSKNNQYNNLCSEKKITYETNTECDSLQNMEISNEVKTKIQDNNIEEYTNQFSEFNFNKEVMFIYYEYKKNGIEITNTITQYAKRKSMLKNLFNKDISEIHVCVFDKTDYDYIGIFEEFIRRNFVKNSLMINGIDIHDYKEYFSDYRKDDLERFKNIEKSLKYISKELDVSFKEMKKIICSIFDNWYKVYINKTNMGALNIDMHKEIVDKILDTLFKNGVVDVKWKNEYRLYTIVHKYFRDAIYQYRPEWLRPQSLDIFIPSLNVAIEYQTIFYKGIMPSEKGFRFSSGL